MESLLKAKFLSELETQDIDDKTAALTKDLVYRSDILQGLLIAPAGFVTDFASVPRLPFVYWLFGGTARRPAVAHDFLYQTHQCADRHTADRVFLEAMEAVGIPTWRRWDMYLGVRLGGYLAWKSGPKRFKKLNSLIGA